jgi:arabinose-5-phosphate isomerase
MLNSNLLQLAKNTLSIEIEALETGITNLKPDFIDIVEKIYNMSSGGRVIVMGMGKSGHVGKKIAATLASVGTPSFFVHPAEAGHGDLGMVLDNDIILTISQSGKSEEIIKLIPFFKRSGIINICMTGNLKSPMSEMADYVINTSVPREACPMGLAPTSSTTLTLALGDALAICLLTKKGYTKEDFGKTHPNGTLGKKLLLTLNQVMSPIQESPHIKANINLKESIYVISSKGLGFVVVVDENLFPIGVFTDGDLRRCLDREIDINQTLISNVMTTTFSSIEEDKLCVEAVKIMSEKKITMLPIVDKEGKLVGAINIRQLLQVGVV